MKVNAQADSLFFQIKIMSEASQVGAEQMPALQQSILDAPTIEALFADIAAYTQLVSVLPKMAAGVQVAPQGISLVEGKEALLAGRLRGLQIRYFYEKRSWCDTLMQTPAGVRLVRIADM
jgi:hypothetical protein